MFLRGRHPVGQDCLTVGQVYGTRRGKPRLYHDPVFLPNIPRSRQGLPRLGRRGVRLRLRKPSLCNPDDLGVYAALLHDQPSHCDR